MSLATEVYVLRDRVQALEELLDRQGTIDRTELSEEPSLDSLANKAADRDAFVEHLMQNLLGEQMSKGAL